MAYGPVTIGRMLDTPRVTLRPFVETDLDAVHDLWTQPGVRRFLWDGAIITREQARDVLTASTGHFRDRRFGLWGVYPRRRGGEGGDAEPLAGFAGCRPWATGAPELMYGLHRSWWGRGLATEACEAVLAYVFDTLGHPLVFAATDPPNLASVRVMERLGMTFDQRIEMHGLDTVVYRLSRERWRRCRAAGGG